MKNSIFVKFLVIFLTAISLVSAIGGAAGIIAMESANLYVNGLELLQDKEFDTIADNIATEYADYYAAKHLSNLSYAMRESDYPDPKEFRGDAKHWQIQMQQGEQVLLSPQDTQGYTLIKAYTRAPIYPIVSSLGPNDAPAGEETETQSHNSAYENVIPPEGYLYYEDKTIRNGVNFDTYYYYYYEAPEYTVTVYMRPEVLENSAVHILTDLYPHRYLFIAIFGMGLLLFAAGLVCLILSAGKNPAAEIRPGGLNRLPLDFYFLLAAITIFAFSLLLTELADWVRYEGPHVGNLSIIAANLLAMILPGIGFVLALAAQVKVPGFPWPNCLLYRFGKILSKGLKWLWRHMQKLYHMLPVLWQWLLLRCILLFTTVLFALLAASGNHSFAWVILAICLFVFLTVLCYNIYTYSILLSGAKQMAGGNLKKKIPTKYLLGIYRHFAESLNALAETTLIAAENEMRSERMKAELITNVSHDIKTPLTSIINYVDLLKQASGEAEQSQYLEILSHQSQRMKKLIQDLVEMSKVSSGNIYVEVTSLDAVETATQALGEFSDKLASAGLTPVLQHTQEPAKILADGRLTWRVLSNLLSNIVKYTMPDTRVFLEISETDTSVVISLKNISKDPISLDVQELTERFVRGDASRNTEGSGLGLHIAKNLMELQGGSLQLQCDGDLFKVLLAFPKAE